MNLKKLSYINIRIYKNLIENCVKMQKCVEKILSFFCLIHWIHLISLFIYLFYM